MSEYLEEFLSDCLTFCEYSDLNFSDIADCLYVSFGRKYEKFNDWEKLFNKFTNNEIFNEFTKELSRDNIVNVETIFKEKYNISFNIFLKIYSEKWERWKQDLNALSSEPIQTNNLNALSSEPIQTNSLKTLSSEPIQTNNLNALSSEPIQTNNLKTLSSELNQNNETTITPFIATHSGIYGETEVINLILTVRPKFEVIRVSSTGHMADIHCTDFENSIKYVVEVKNKKAITKEDVDKFERDLSEISKSETNIIGLFICLEAENIPTIGRFQITKNKIYLTKSYISVELFELIFTYIPIIYGINTNNNSEKTVITYQIPQNVYFLLANLQKVQQNTKKEIETLQNSNNTLASLIGSNHIIISSMITKDKIMSEIVREFAKEINVFEIQTQNVEQELEQELRTYLKELKKSKIKKSDILDKFSGLKTKLASMTLDQILEKYRYSEK